MAAATRASEPKTWRASGTSLEQQGKRMTNCQRDARRVTAAVLVVGAAAGALLAACSSSSGGGSTAEPDSSVVDSGTGFEDLDASVPTESGETPDSGRPNHPDAAAPPNNANDSGPSPVPDAGPIRHVRCGLGDGGAPDDFADAGAVASDGGLGFLPSNFDPSKVTTAGVGVIDIADDCTYDDGTNAFSCATASPPSAFHAAAFSQDAGGPSLTVLVVRSLVVEQGRVLTFTGANPIAIEALDSIHVLGTLLVSAGRYAADAGPGTNEENTYSGTDQGAAGGSHCGGGGTGIITPYPPASAYGNTTLIPLAGGSYGCSPTGGPGGGAVQLVARNIIEIGPCGEIYASGLGGRVPGGGGGSGGSILIEAPMVSLAGALLAAGGSSAGSSTPGNDGTDNGGQAGGVGFLNGGAGSTGTSIDGGTGGYLSTGDNDWGGGGGAGWIRINSTGGNVTPQVGAVVNPALSSSCVSQGPLR